MARAQMNIWPAITHITREFFNDLKANYPDRYDAQYDQYRNLHKENNINPGLKKDVKYFVRSTMPHIIKPAKNFIGYYKQKEITLLLK